MRTLAAALARTFKAPAPRRPDPHRKQREQAKAWASDWHVEIERLPGGGFNVWPPKDWTLPDPLEGDHFCSDWAEVYDAVCYYRPEV